MASYMVTYDLGQPNRDYEKLKERIKGISGTWAFITESSYIVVSNQKNSVQIRDDLAQAIDDDDMLFVAKLSGEGAWKNLSDEKTKWLKAHL